MMRLSALRLWRLERGLPQHELARRTGIADYRLARIENGIVEPGAEELNRISTVLRVPAHHLYADNVMLSSRARASSD